MLSFEKVLRTTEEIEKRSFEIVSVAYEEAERAQQEGFDYNPHPILYLCLLAERNLGMAQMCLRLVNELETTPGLVIRKEDLSSFKNRIFKEIDDLYPLQTNEEAEEIMVEIRQMEHEISKVRIPSK